MDYPPHAMSRYAAVTESLIEKCQQDYRAGRNLGRSIPSLDAGQAAIVVAESLEADAMLNWSPTKQMNAARQGAVSDWSLIVLAEIFFTAAEDVNPQQDIFAQTRREEFEDLAWTALEKALDSPTASPTVWYEEIYFDVAQRYRLNRNPKALELLERGLAYDLRFYEARNAVNFLRDLAETHLLLNQLDRGLHIYTELLHFDPTDIWTYNAMAISFDDFGLAQLGETAARRGLTLLKTLGDPHHLEEQLTNSVADMQNSEQRGREADADPEAVQALTQALQLDFAAGFSQPLPDFCHQLVPNLKQVPLKQPKKPPQLRSQAADKPGRNDLCWCGSGKKYKHCHMRADLKASR